MLRATRFAFRRRGRLGFGFARPALPLSLANALARLSLVQDRYLVAAVEQLGERMLLDALTWQLQGASIRAIDAADVVPMTFGGIGVSLSVGTPPESRACAKWCARDSR